MQLIQNCSLCPSPILGHQSTDFIVVVCSVYTAISHEMLSTIFVHSFVIIYCLLLLGESPAWYTYGFVYNSVIINRR